MDPSGEQAGRDYSGCFDRHGVLEIDGQERARSGSTRMVDVELEVNGRIVYKASQLPA